MTNTIILVVGARPNFMKIAPIYTELLKRKQNLILLHTGQHYDDNMSKVFFDDLGMPQFLLSQKFDDFDLNQKAL